jgi:hypothetical protein
MDLNRDEFAIFYVLLHESDHNLSKILKKVDFDILKISTHCSSHYSVNKNFKNHIVLCGFT